LFRYLHQIGSSDWCPLLVPYKGCVHVRYLMCCFVTRCHGEKFLAPPQPPSWRTNTCLRSATAYSIYSQLLSISGGLLRHLQHRMNQGVVTGSHLPRTTDYYICNTERVKFIAVIHNVVIRPKALVLSCATRLLVCGFEPHSGSGWMSAVLRVCRTV
jgi:hypothetical protein